MQSEWQQVQHGWASDNYSHGIPTQYNAKCENWKSSFSPANQGAGLALLFLIHTKEGEEFNVTASYQIHSCVTSNGGWALKRVDPSMGWERGGCALQVSVINSYSSKSKCVKEPKLCFVLSAEYSVLAELSREMGAIPNEQIQLQILISEKSVGVQTQNISSANLSGSDKDTKNHSSMQNTKKKSSWSLSSQYLLVFPFNRDA